MEQRYQMLRRMQPVLRVLAWVVAAFTLANSVLGFRGQLPYFTSYLRSGEIPVVARSVAGFLSGLVVAGLWWVALTASAHLISVAIEIAQNTRARAEPSERPGATRQVRT